MDLERGEDGGYMVLIWASLERRLRREAISDGAAAGGQGLENSGG